MSNDKKSSSQEPPKGWYQFGTFANNPQPYGVVFSKQEDEAGLPLWERPIRLADPPTTPREIDALWETSTDPMDRVDDFDYHAYGRLEDRMINQGEPRI